MFSTSPHASFQIASLTIYWYGVCITLGILLGYLLILRRSAIYGIAKSHIENAFLVVIPSAIIGARLYHVMLEWDYYSRDLMQIFNLRAGGLAIHGALIGAIVSLYIYVKINKLDVWPLLDLCAPSVALGHALGRWGNYFNQELYGGPTDLPWKLYIDPMHRLPAYFQYEYFHPTFLYESLLNLLNFAILIFLASRWKKESRGRVFAAYLVGYGLIRFFTESIRIDELSVLGPFKFAQLSSLVLLLVGIAVLYFKTKRTVGEPETQG